LMTAQCGLTYWPPMQTMFGTESIDAHTWKYIVIVAASLFVLVEIEKTIIRTVKTKL
jgi:hypothetical protein